jgi:hypothetical protein
MGSKCVAHAVAPRRRYPPGLQRIAVTLASLPSSIDLPAFKRGLSPMSWVPEYAFMRPLRLSGRLSGAPTLGKDKKGTAIPAKTAQGSRSVRGPIPLHNAITAAAPGASAPLTSSAFDAEEASSWGSEKPKSRTQATSHANRKARLIRGPWHEEPIYPASSRRYVGVTY